MRTTGFWKRCRWGRTKECNVPHRTVLEMDVVIKPTNKQPSFFVLFLHIALSPVYARKGTSSFALLSRSLVLDFVVLFVDTRFCPLFFQRISAQLFTLKGRYHSFFFLFFFLLHPNASPTAPFRSFVSSCRIMNCLVQRHASVVVIWDAEKYTWIRDTGV